MNVPTNEHRNAPHGPITNGSLSTNLIQQIGYAVKSEAIQQFLDPNMKKKFELENTKKRRNRNKITSKLSLKWLI